MRLVRLTWTIGGIGLILSAVIGLLRYLRLDVGPAIAVSLDVVFAAAVLLFAIGLSKEASVVARRPLGVVALTILAVWPLALRLVHPFLPDMSSAFDAGLDAYREAETILTAVSFANLLVMLSAGLIGAIQIARARNVPTPWRWAPLWAVIASLAAGVLPQLLFVAGTAGTQYFTEVAIISSVLDLLPRTLGLGILALVLASQHHAGKKKPARVHTLPAT
ncbi:hypothetical protein BH10ACT7_BH10ACT7_07320 [soil metagenome]